MNKNIVLACLASLTACALEARDTEITPVASPDRIEAWTSTVQRAIGIWQSAAGDDCQIPLYVGDSGPEARLVPQDEWTDERYSGLYRHETGQIFVRDDDAAGILALAIHELGHAMMGSAHSADPTSVMVPTPERNRLPGGSDVARLRAALGCTS